MLSKIRVYLCWDELAPGVLNCEIRTSSAGLDTICVVDFAHIKSVQQIDELADSLLQRLRAYRTWVLRRKIPAEHLDRELIRQRLRQKAQAYFEAEEIRVLRERRR